MELQALGDIVVRGRFEIKLSKHAASLLLNDNIWCYRIVIIIPDATWFQTLRAVGKQQEWDTLGPEGSWGWNRFGELPEGSNTHPWIL